MQYKNNYCHTLVPWPFFFFFFLFLFSSLFFLFFLVSPYSTFLSHLFPYLPPSLLHSVDQNSSRSKIRKSEEGDGKRLAKGYDHQLQVTRRTRTGTAILNLNLNLARL
jgi:hypothetical protein